MECEICFEAYDKADRAPLILACKCRKVMCISCVHRRLDSTARCPYCDIRWSVRNYITQCKEVTPSDILEKLQSIHQVAVVEVPCLEVYSTLGSGELRKYYEKSVQEVMRKAEENSADQIEYDKKIAKTLSENLQKEDEEKIAFVKRIEKEDALMAARMAKEAQNTSDRLFFRKDRIYPREYKNGIDKFVNVAQKNTSPISTTSCSSSSSSSSSSSTSSSGKPIRRVEPAAFDSSSHSGPSCRPSQIEEYGGDRNRNIKWETKKSSEGNKHGELLRSNSRPEEAPPPPRPDNDSFNSSVRLPAASADNIGNSRSRSKPVGGSSCSSSLSKNGIVTYLVKRSSPTELVDDIVGTRTDRVAVCRRFENSREVHDLVEENDLDDSSWLSCKAPHKTALQGTATTQKVFVLEDEGTERNGSKDENLRHRNDLRRNSELDIDRILDPRMQSLHGQDIAVKGTEVDGHRASRPSDTVYFSDRKTEKKDMDGWRGGDKDGIGDRCRHRRTVPKGPSTDTHTRLTSTIWNCTACTYENQIRLLNCDMCGTQRDPN